MCEIHLRSTRSPKFDGVSRYACPIECSVVQEAISKVAKHLHNCAAIGLTIDRYGAATIVLWTAKALASHRIHPEDPVDIAYQPTRETIQTLFEAVPDLSELEVIKIKAKRSVRLVEVNELCIEVVDDEAGGDFDDESL